MAESSDDDHDRNGGQARWQSIEVRHLAALAAVAREGSFRRAAEELGYVQSAISGQIAHLEQAAGARLLERASGTPLVTLTDAGRLLLRHIDEILARFEAAYADVDSLAARNAGAVRVAGLQQFAPSQVGAVLSLFRQRHPFARVLMEDSTDTARDAAALGNGTLDLLIYELQGPDESPQNVLTHDCYVLVVPRSGELAARTTPLTARELSAARPIVPNSCGRSETLRAQLTRLGLRPHPSVVTDSVAVAQSLVAGGLGCALVPSRLLGSEGPDTVRLDLSHLIAPQTIALRFAADRARHPAVVGFARAVRETCGDGAAFTSPTDRDQATPLPRAA